MLMETRFLTHVIQPQCPYFQVSGDTRLDSYYCIPGLFISGLVKSFQDLDSTLKMNIFLNESDKKGGQVNHCPCKK